MAHTLAYNTRVLCRTGHWPALLLSSHLHDSALHLDACYVMQRRCRHWNIGAKSPPSAADALLSSRVWASTMPPWPPDLHADARKDVARNDPNCLYITSSSEHNGSRLLSVPGRHNSVNQLSRAPVVQAPTQSGHCVPALDSTQLCTLQSLRQSIKPYISHAAHKHQSSAVITGNGRLLFGYALSQFT